MSDPLVRGGCGRTGDDVKGYALASVLCAIGLGFVLAWAVAL